MEIFKEPLPAEIPPSVKIIPITIYKVATETEPCAGYFMTYDQAVEYAQSLRKY